jgi:hypothetical protein
MLLIQLLLAHFIGDFVLQPQKWIQDKEEKKFKSVYLYLHAGLHAFLMLLFLNFEAKYILPVFFISLSHLVIDGVKLLKPIQNVRYLFFIDQFLHLAILYWFYSGWSLTFNFAPYLTEKHLLFLLAILLLTSVTSIVLKIVFSLWEKDIKELQKKDGSLLNAGRYIGMLERLFVFIFIIMDQWEAIGFLLAAKSVFRFGDLTKASDRKLTEYILIGTFLSFGIAIVIGIVFLKLTQR